ncbi:MAG: CheR family methyltransferase [Planctomycetota bacterium]
MLEHMMWAVIADYLKTEIGYAIPPGKYYLLAANLGRLLGHGRRTPQDLLSDVQKDSRLRQELIDGATINESHFFRDPSLWRCLSRQVLPRIRSHLDGECHILICACSRGQEVYSLRMLLADHPDMRDLRCHITAVDVDSTVLAQAEQGCYSELDVSRGLDPIKRRHYFQKTGSGSWQVVQELKRDSRFQCINLNQDFSFPRRFDLVFCRNVLIYFEPARKGRILDRLAQYTSPHGYLILGGAETTLGLSNQWTPCSLEDYTVYGRRL